MTFERLICRHKRHRAYLLNRHLHIGLLYNAIKTIEALTKDITLPYIRAVNGSVASCRQRNKVLISLKLFLVSDTQSPMAHQDTCVALQALSEYAILSYMGGVNLTISLASTNLDFQETFELHRENKKILQSAKVLLIFT